MKKCISLLLTLLLFVTAFACGTIPDNGGNGNGGGEVIPPEETDEKQEEVNAALSKLSAEDFTYAQLMGVDELGRRTLPTVGVNGKYVGMFYFVGMGMNGHERIFDNTQLLEKYGANAGNPVFALPKNVVDNSAVNANYDETVSPYAVPHYWGEPLYGYYRSTDKWVIRRHLELFMNAGIDFLYLDYSNAGIYYNNTVRALTQVITELQAEGFKNVPKLTFMLPNAASDSLTSLNYIYDQYYVEGKNDSCWFRGDETVNPGGKPMLVGRFKSNMNKMSAEISKYFWFKELQWPSSAADENSFPWIEWNGASSSQPNHGGIMNVSIAQHVNSWSSTSYLDNLSGKKSYRYRARGFDPSQTSQYGTDPAKVLAGSNFEWQFQNALGKKDDLYMLTITGWNEWAALKIKYSASDYAVFNDLFDMTFSRDAEMMKGGYGDNYYMQTSRNVREFKGRRIAGTDNVAKFARVTPSGIEEASKLPAVFADIGGDAAARRDTAVDSKIEYTDLTNRNNILSVSAGNDQTYLYVAVKTKTPVSGRTAEDSGWMNLYLDCGEENGHSGYNFVVNRNPDFENGKTTVERFIGTRTGVSEVGTADFAVSEDMIFYRIPLASIGGTANSVIGIKAADNLQKFGDADDFYVSGDCAPLGRFSYAYKIS